ncbi:MAG: hypothetical protein V7711_01430 [Pseudomonadales bacterium]
MVLQIIIIAFGITCVLIPLARVFGWEDIPGGRKDHNGNIPLVGGIAIFLTILTGTYLLDITPYTPAVLLVTLIPFIVGVIDDKVHISPTLRLAIHFGSGVLLATWGGIVISQVGNLLGFGDIPLLLLAIPLTALAAAGLCNAYNMIDGIDGLAAATMAIPLSTLTLLAYEAQHPAAPAVLLILLPVLVFLCFNLQLIPRLPKIFLGDGGSVTLGFLITASLVYFSQGPQAAIQPVTALWLVTLPLMDMLATMLRRVKHGLHPMEADKSHLHHIIQRMGLNNRETFAVLVTYAVACSLIGLALEDSETYISLIAYILLFAGHCLFVMQAFRISRFVRKHSGKPEVSERTINWIRTNKPK